MRYRSRLSVIDKLREASLATRSRRVRIRPVRARVWRWASVPSSRSWGSPPRVGRILLAQLDRFGTNLLDGARQTLSGEAAPLPARAIGMIGRIPPVTAVSAVGALPQLSVRRTDLVPAFAGGGIGVQAARLDPLTAVGGSVSEGTFLNAATATYPAVVLGSAAARHLRVERLDRLTQVGSGIATSR